MAFSNFQTIAIIFSRNLLLTPWWKGYHYYCLLKGRNGTSGIVSDRRAMFVYSHCGTYDYRAEKAVDHLHEDDRQYLQSKCSRLDKPYPLQAMIPVMLCWMTTAMSTRIRTRS